MDINSSPRNFSVHIYTVINVGLMFLTFIESYLFPFTIIKWIVVIAKFGGLNKLLHREASAGPLCTRYKYELHLMTVCTKDVSLNEISHVNVLVEGEILQLTYCGQDCKRIPPALQKMYGPKVKYLDLSYNSIETLKGLEEFTRLEELILDNNELGDAITFPYLPRLRTLSLNNNQLTDLEGFVSKISSSYPALSYLSILSNKACPNELSDLDKDDSDYQRYRYFLIYKLPNLRFLDSRRVSSKERSEGMTRGQFTRVRRPQSDADASPDAGPALQRDPTARPLPVDFNALGKHKGAYGKCVYRYTGKHSEGNRFIVNSDL